MINPVEISNLLPFDGSVFLYEDFFDTEDSCKWHDDLLAGIEWKQEPIMMWGKAVMQPRLTAWYGEPEKAYTYSGITMKPKTWTGSLVEIKNRIEKISGHIFNSALLNLYRDGNDSMGWHRDNEKELGQNPVIASVSFGATRKFKLRHYRDKTLIKTLGLTNGSLLLMKNETQHYWYHSVPKEPKVSQSRINITFRSIL